MPLIMMDVVSPYVTCTQTNEALDRQGVGGQHRDRRLPVEAAGTISQEDLYGARRSA